MKRIISILFWSYVGVLFIFPQAVLASITPSISVISGSTTVEVGELVVFDALDTTTDNVLIELGKARYEWDFKDGYTYKWHSGIPGSDPFYYLKNGARTVSHYFMTPGVYDVSLTTSAWESYQDSGYPPVVSTTSTSELTIGTGSKTFTVGTGLELVPTMFGTLIDTASGLGRYMKGYITSYNSSTGEVVMDCINVSGTGSTYSAWSFSAELLPHEGPTTTTVQITVTGEAPMSGFELQHAPLLNRSKQYIHAMIPAAHRGGSTQLKVSLIGDSAGTTVLVAPKNNLAADEEFLLDHTGLGVDNWCLQAELLDSGGTRLAGGIWRDKWSKTHAGLPKVYFDENNSMHVDGELFFMQAPFIVNASNQAEHITNGGHNSFFGTGYYAEGYTPETYASYLATSTTNGVYVIGPGAGTYSVQYSGNRWKGNSNTDIMRQYVSANKNSPAAIGWNWHDEPNLGGESEKVYPPVLAAWKWVSNDETQQHLGYHNFVGSDWSNYYTTHPHNFDYIKSHVLMGGKKWGQEVISWDTYPVTQRAYAIQNFVDRGPYAAYLEAVDNTREGNPYTPWIAVPQPCGGMSNYIVTANQMWHEMWLNVVKGAKGFCYFIKGNKPTPETWPSTVLWDEMLAFSQYIELWKGMILGTPPTNTVSDNSNANLNRVETMLREKDGVSYIWAVRVTEPPPIPEDPALKYLGEEPETITTTFTCSNSDITGEVGVLEMTAGADGYHTVTATNGVFTDTLPENAVRLYTFPAQGGGDPVAAKATIGASGGGAVSFGSGALPGVVFGQ